MNSMDIELVIGLEVHVQLATRTKLFCGCPTEFGAPPNTQVCPVCLGHPGTLPVLNSRAVELAIQTGVALNCQIAELTKWDRKNYFYPDLPKGYQISQFDKPICGPGWLEFPDREDPQGTLKVRFVRAHLEEDAGKSMHDEQGGRADSRIDLNRAGTPLLEIVTEPDLRSPQAAKAFLTELRLLLTYLGVSDCNMQEGSLRVDANVNLHIIDGGRRLATPIVEVKNLNSFRAVERALAYERERQWESWRETGQLLGDVPKQTRGWDENQGVTLPQREKEESSDYRYFPDPDLVPLQIDPQQVQRVRQAVAMRPLELRRKLQHEYGIKPYDADVIVAQGRSLVEYFETAVAAGGPPKRVSSWIQQDVLRTLNETGQTLEEFAVTAERLAVLLQAVEAGELENSRARDVFQYWLQHPMDDLAAAKGALGIQDVDETDLVELCRDLLHEHPQIVQQAQAGDMKGLGALIGAAKKRNPNVDPRKVRAICQQLIESGF
ncbi:MAG: Asp-tRNA(Asn)/Glu-tRNA(Gln) amidotransferase subunit GatB [Planctomycetota bacterium]|nr:MAG: Asp-tRNA(Asn)/Glu-tRNA(Gln) amidotransferase subunit GatB [Planctomycetota bacterium]